ncbi:hypothetical protein [Promicromonospora sp. MEB111]|uniref:hypothetical protein n=1 Tax=Promicromonospora sp. MEB111 TaxID=3040301 RepID=UPI00255075F1|nr:hypothetical protein [Promicromonospora sp. MEB111]
MSATRRKGSRGGRAASRAGGPPASNALTWAESLAAGEAAPGASALEWAEGLAQNDTATPSPWGSAGASAAPADPAPAEESGTGSPWGPVPAPVVVDGEDAAPGEPEGDANPWGSVAAAEPAAARGRSKNAGGKSGKAGKSRSKGKGAKSGAKGAPKDDTAPTPAGGFPLNVGPAADEAPEEALPEDDVPAAPSTPPSRGQGSTKAGKGPRGRIPTPSTAQQRKIKRTLRRGLPPFLDRPMVLVLAGVIAAVLGLGTGWGMDNLPSSGGAMSSADAASCAQTQMAWTQAANAQSAMVEDQPETLRKGFINARNALDGVTPPEAISADWAVAFTYYSTVANNIEKVKANDGPAVLSAVGGAQEELDTEAMIEATKAIGLYVNSNCRQ